MYIGIGPENGKRVYERDAFGYVCDRVLIGDEMEQSEFMDIAKDSESVREFSSVVTGWYFSGNWLYDPSDNKKTSYIIRFQDNSLHGFYGTYFEAVEFAKELSKKNGMGFVVN